VFVKDSQDLGNLLTTVFRTATGRHNLLRSGNVEMRPPTRHGAVAAIPRVTVCVMSHNRVIRNTYCHYIYFLHDGIVRRKGTPSPASLMMALPRPERPLVVALELEGGVVEAGSFQSRCGWLKDLAVGLWVL
jgi:hypothetical protein